MGKVLLFIAVISVSCKQRQESNLLSTDATNTYDWYVRLAKDLSVGQYKLQRTDFYRLRSKSDREVFNYFWAERVNKYVFGLDFAAFKLAILTESMRINGYQSELANPTSDLYRYPQAITFAKQIEHNLPQDYFFSFRQPLWTTENSAPDFPITSVNEYQNALTEDGFMRTHPNSILNRNRKRAAYFIENYFCDELVSKNIDVTLFEEDKKNHDRHVTPTCHSCHYKLDPMAGAIAELDQRAGGRIYQVGVSTLEGEAIRDYLRPWRFRGYVHKPTSSPHTVRMDTPAQLFEGMGQSEIVRQCFVKKTVQYFLGKSQAVDQDWILHLTDEFSQGWRQDFSQAFEQLLFRVVSSKAYKAVDRQVDLCYDLPPNSSENREVPCHIKFVIENNCSSCHNDLTNAINFSQWQTYPDGNFYESRWSQAAVAREKMHDALRTNDPVLRMPLGLDMPSDDRQRLSNWILEGVR